MTPFPWIEAMQFGFGVLRLSSEAFWKLTPRELSHAIAGARGCGLPPLDRSGLEALMRCYPDQAGG